MLTAPHRTLNGTAPASLSVKPATDKPALRGRVLPACWLRKTIHRHRIQRCRHNNDSGPRASETGDPWLQEIESHTPGSPSILPAKFHRYPRQNDFLREGLARPKIPAETRPAF